MTFPAKWIRWCWAASALAVLAFLLVNGLYAAGLLSVSAFLWGAGLSAGGVCLLAVSSSGDDFSLEPFER